MQYSSRSSTIVTTGEPGEAIGKIDLHDPARRFDGYVNDQATAKKVIS